LQHVLNFAGKYAKVVKDNRSVTEVSREVVLVRRRLPPKGWVKLNTDGVCEEGAIAGWV